MVNSPLVKPLPYFPHRIQHRAVNPLHDCDGFVGVLVRLRWAAGEGSGLRAAGGARLRTAGGRYRVAPAGWSGVSLYSVIVLGMTLIATSVMAGTASGVNRPED